MIKLLDGFPEGTTKLRVTGRADLKRARATGQLVGLPGFSREQKSRLQAALESTVPEQR